MHIKVVEIITTLISSMFTQFKENSYNIGFFGERQLNFLIIFNVNSNNIQAQCSRVPEA